MPINFNSLVTSEVAGSVTSTTVDTLMFSVNPSTESSSRLSIIPPEVFAVTNVAL